MLKKPTSCFALLVLMKANRSSRFVFGLLWPASKGGNIMNKPKVGFASRNEVGRSRRFEKFCEKRLLSPHRLTLHWNVRYVDINGSLAIEIPYNGVDGKAPCRYRFLDNERFHNLKGSSWKGSLYNPDMAIEGLAVQDEPVLYICEGETDAWTLDWAGFPSVTCLPGASTWQGDSYDNLKLQEAVKAVDGRAVVIADNDNAGEKLLDDVERDLAGWGDSLYLAQPPDPYNDLNQMFIGMEGFIELFRYKLKLAVWGD